VGITTILETRISLSLRPKNCGIIVESVSKRKKKYLKKDCDKKKAWD
jgi:hypothetical protein